MTYFFNVFLDFCGFVVMIVGLPLVFVAGVITAYRLILGWREHANEMAMQRAELDLMQLENERARLDLAIIAIDPSRPVFDRLGVASGRYAQGMYDFGMRYLDSLQPVQHVPTTLHYAPHLINKADPKQLEQVERPLLAAAQLPDFGQLYSQRLLPGDKFLIGADIESGEFVTAGWRDFYSTLIGGAPGSGKSTLVRSILAQAALQGSQFMVIDPHFGAGDESLGESLSPLQSKMLTAVAYTDAQMIATLKNITDVGRRRLAGEDTNKAPVVLIVDETTGLLQRGAVRDTLIDTLGFIAQETRKVAVYAICIGQMFTAKVLPSEVRNCFVNFISCRTRKDNARYMTGNSEFAEIVEGLTTGQCVRMTPAGEVQMLAVPNCTQAHLEMVAGADGAFRGPGAAGLLTSHTGKSDFQGDKNSDVFGQVEVTGKSDGSQAEVTDAQTQRIIGLFCDGLSVTDIVRDMNDGKEITGGRLMQTESARVQSVIRDYMRKVQQIGGKSNPE